MLRRYFLSLLIALAAFAAGTGATRLVNSLDLSQADTRKLSEDVEVHDFMWQCRNADGIGLMAIDSRSSIVVGGPPVKYWSFFVLKNEGHDPIRYQVNERGNVIEANVDPTVPASPYADFSQVYSHEVTLMPSEVDYIHLPSFESGRAFTVTFRYAVGSRWAARSTKAYFDGEHRFPQFCE